METSKEFVSYEDALELKKLGFNEPCLYGYDTFAAVISTSTKWENWNQSLQLVSAPLYQQAFRFFRGKGIAFSIVNIEDKKGKTCYSFVIGEQYYYDLGSGNDMFSTVYF